MQDAARLAHIFGRESDAGRRVDHPVRSREPGPHQEADL